MMDALIASKKKGGPQALSLDHVSPATRLLEKRRQMFEVQDELDRQKEEFSRKEDAFARREGALRKRDVELQESLVKFNKFLQENESKRTRAIKRASDEIAQRRVKEGEIDKLEQVLKERIAEEQAMRRQLELHEKYRLYLQAVVDQGETEFHEIQDLLNRHKTLKTANRDLSLALRQAEQDNEDQRNSFTSFKKERSNEILLANNDIANLQRSLELDQSATKKLVVSLDTAITGGSTKTRQVGQVLRAIDNLLERVCTHKARATSSGGAGGAGGAGGGTSGGGGGGGASASQLVATIKGRSNQQQEEKGGEGDGFEEETRQAEDSLVEICEHMVDYQAIVEEWASYEERKIKEAMSRIDEE